MVGLPGVDGELGMKGLNAVLHGPLVEIENSGGTLVLDESITSLIDISEALLLCLVSVPTQAFPSKSRW